MPKKHIKMEADKLRLNSKIISSVNDPIYTIPISKIEQSVMQGKVYSASARDLAMIANGFALFQVTVPANIGRVIAILRILGSAYTTGTEGFIEIDLFKNATFTGGTTITIRNMGWVFPDNSVCTAKAGVTANATDPTIGGILLSSMYHPNQTAAFLLELEGLLLIPSINNNQTMYLRMKNISRAHCKIKLN